MKLFGLVCCLVTAASAEEFSEIPLKEVPSANVSASGKIINGIEAGRGQYPWQVGIYNRVNNRRQFCGGALISNQWVLTAAHCVYGASNFEVILGATRLDIQQPGKISVGVRRALYHPRYNYPAPLNNDIAVIQLNQQVYFNDYVQPLRLPRRGWKLQDYTWTVVSGWGKTSDFQNDIVNNLNFVQLTTISNQQCKQYFAASLVQDSVVCCDGRQHKSTCQGDSGGPLIQQLNGRWYSVGVVSFISTEGCDLGHPMGFTRTESHLDFIYANTGIKSE